MSKSRETVHEKRTVITSSSSSNYDDMGDTSTSSFKSTISPRNTVLSRSSGLPGLRSGMSGDSGTMITRTVEYGYGKHLGGLPSGGYEQRTNTGVNEMKQNREKEKRDMQDLNERFASYIEKVRFLEAQNRKLGSELEHLKSKWGKETSQVKQMYEAELAEARKLIDDLTREKANLEIKNSSLQEQMADMQRQLDEAKKYRQIDREQINKLNQQLSDYESEVNMLRRTIESLETDRQRDRDRISQLQADVDRLRIDLNNETLNHLDAENRRQTLEEEMDFLKKLHEQELKELAALAYRDTTEENREFWKNELSQAIRDIQREYDQKSDQIRGDMEAYYNLKVQEFRTGATKQNMEVTHVREENKKLTKQMSDLRGRLADLEARNAQLEKQYQDLLREYEQIEADHTIETAQFKEEITKMRAEMESILQELQTLMDAKLSLELEILAYRKLLEGEETRADRFRTLVGLTHTRVSSPWRRFDSDNGHTKRDIDVDEKVSVEDEKTERDITPDEELKSFVGPKEETMPTVDSASDKDDGEGDDDEVTRKSEEEVEETLNKEELEKTESAAPTTETGEAEDITKNVDDAEKDGGDESTDDTAHQGTNVDDLNVKDDRTNNDEAEAKDTEQLHGASDDENKEEEENKSDESKMGDDDIKQQNTDVTSSDALDVAKEGENALEESTDNQSQEKTGEAINVVETENKLDDKPNVHLTEGKPEDKQDDIKDDVTDDENSKDTKEDKKDVTPEEKSIEEEEKESKSEIEVEESVSINLEETKSDDKTKESEQTDEKKESKTDDNESGEDANLSEEKECKSDKAEEGRKDTKDGDDALNIIDDAMDSSHDDTKSEIEKSQDECGDDTSKIVINNATEATATVNGEPDDGKSRDANADVSESEDKSKVDPSTTTDETEKIGTVNGEAKDDEEKSATDDTDSSVSMRMMRGEVSAKTTYQRTSTGPISISEVSPDGKFIVLENTSSNKREVDMNKWKLKRTVDGKRDYVYEFRNFTLKPGKSVKIFARGSASEAGLNDLVFRDEDSWGVGSQVSTCLLNEKSEEKATHTQRTNYN